MRKDSSQPHPTDRARTRRPRGSLTPEVILDTAEEVAADGFGALTMRAVAARLGAVPMALYNHFATTEQLVDALLDRVLSRFEPQPHTDDWAEDLRRFARAHRRLLVRHPWAGRAAVHPAQPRDQLRPHRRIRPRHPPPRRPLQRACRRRLQRHHRAQLRLVVLHHRARPRPRGPRPRRRRDARRAATHPIPLTVDVAAELGAYGSDHHYDFVLDQLLSGLRATARAEPG